ncbi:hypothetical protein JZ751_026287 [Albula glossodonta]|uniref:Uncharacterized protein n=1 Tax=Albula glossodonta TaxID=121402 RepID=A0A8T2PBJ0_9TELE|nr:hypothetical protein JZ751_026287 [Albula glossodonta]
MRLLILTPLFPPSTLTTSPGRGSHEQDLALVSLHTAAGQDWLQESNDTDTDTIWLKSCLFPAKLGTARSCPTSGQCGLPVIASTTAARTEALSHGTSTTTTCLYCVSHPETQCVASIELMQDLERPAHDAHLQLRKKIPAHLILPSRSRSPATV